MSWVHRGRINLHHHRHLRIMILKLHCYNLLTEIQSFQHMEMCCFETVICHINFIIQDAPRVFKLFHFNLPLMPKQKYIWETRYETSSLDKWNQPYFFFLSTQTLEEILLDPVMPFLRHTENNAVWMTKKHFWFQGRVHYILTCHIWCMNQLISVVLLLCWWIQIVSCDMGIWLQHYNFVFVYLCVCSSLWDKAMELWPYSQGVS